MAKQSNVESIEINAADITDYKSYQLPIENTALGDITFTLKSVNGLSVKEREKELQARAAFVQNCMKEISINFLKMGKMLTEIEADFDFTKSEYLSFYAFCSAKFDLGKTTVVNLKNVYQAFAERIVSDNKYAKYTYTQLVELLPLAGTEHEEVITPEMTITQIRAYKKELKKNQKGTTEIVRKNEDDEVKLSDKIINFDDVSSARGFLLGYYGWELIGEVNALYIEFFKCYLSDGEKSIELVAEQFSLGKVTNFVFHYLDECGQFFHSNMDLSTAAKFVIQGDYSARLVPFDDARQKQKKAS